MITAKIAFEKAQDVNRFNWIKAAGERLSNKIMAEASLGKRELVLDFDEFIVGAENLFEAGEMLANFNKILEDGGFKHVITPNGTLIISW